MVKWGIGLPGIMSEVATVTKGVGLEKDQLAWH